MEKKKNTLRIIQNHLTLSAYYFTLFMSVITVVSGYVQVYDRLYRSDLRFSLCAVARKE